MNHATYLPSIGNAPTIPGQSEPDRARLLFTLLRDHAEQARRGIVWDSVLAKAAYYKCYSQAHQGWDGHVDPDGNGPHDLVRRFGYKLPANYPNGDANYIESLCHGGDGEALSAWTALLSSAGHRTHVLGLIEFYAAQTHVGIGYFGLETSAKRHYFCVLTCHPEQGA